MALKHERYSAKEEVDDLDLLTEKLSHDLRNSVRQLEKYPILSDPWFEMVEIFGRIANISDMESKLSSSKKDATLWETEEQALRFLLEDGKLNFCLRSLIEFKTAQINTRKTKKGPMMDFTVECDKFEKGLGTIFKNAWLHVEVLQTTDLPALVHHIADVLCGALDQPSLLDNLISQGDLHQRQEILVFYYLQRILRRIEDIRESRVMPIIRERRLFMNAIEMLGHIGTSILNTHRQKIAESLSMMAETEDFITYRNEYHNYNTDVAKMLEFKEDFLSDLAKDMEARRSSRPLIDAIEKGRRQLRYK